MYLVAMSPMPCLADQFVVARDFLSALAREDFPLASRATLGNEIHETAEGVRKDEAKLTFVAKVYEFFVRELGPMIETRELDDEPDRVLWITFEAFVDESEKDLERQTAHYEAQFAYQGRGFVRLVSFPNRVPEVSFGIPDEEPDSRRRMSELVGKYARLQEQAMPESTTSDVRRITIP